MTTPETTTPTSDVAASDAGATGVAAFFGRATTALFLLAVVSVPFMQPFTLRVLGSAVQLADALFALVGVVWLASLVLGGNTLRKGRFYGLLALFLLAAGLALGMAPVRNAGRLVIEIYLIGLSILAYNIVRSPRDLRRLWTVWTGTAGFTAAAILVSVALFYLAGLKDPRVNPILWTAGSLPVGNYPRVKGFFLNGNMTGNYLAVSACFAFGLAALSSGKKRAFTLAAGLAIGAAALFTLSTALGGLAIAVGLFAWLLQTGASRSKWLKALLPLAGVAALALLAFTAAYPKKLDGALVLEASPRWLTWASSWKSFAAHPIFGNGLGVALADVHYDTPRGVHENLTDPHNAWLSVAGQMGLVGLLAFLAMLLWFARGLKGMAIVGDQKAIARAALAGALVVVVYQAFSCSVEDMRHLWLLFGLIAGVVETPRGAAQSPPRDAPQSPSRALSSSA